MVLSVQLPSDTQLTCSPLCSPTLLTDGKEPLPGFAGITLIPCRDAKLLHGVWHVSRSNDVVSSGSRRFGSIETDRHKAGADRVLRRQET